MRLLPYLAGHNAANADAWAAMTTRRGLLAGGFATAGSWLAGRFAPLLAGDRQFRIGACDWSIGHTSDTAAFETARAIGLERPAGQSARSAVRAARQGERCAARHGKVDFARVREALEAIDYRG